MGESSTGGKYVKPSWEGLSISMRNSIKRKMLKAGGEALKDALEVMK